MTAPTTPSPDAPAGTDLPGPDDVDRLDADPVRTLDAELSAAMVAEIDAAKKDGDTLGGVVEVLAHGLPPGLGSHVHWDRRLDARLAAALMGQASVRGVSLEAPTGSSEVHVEVTDMGDFARALPALARSAGITVRELTPTDESLESVFTYLVQS